MQLTEVERWLSSSDLISHATEIVALSCQVRDTPHTDFMSSSFLSLKQSVMTHDICVNIYPSRHCLRSSSPQIKYYLLTLLQVEFHFSKGILLIEFSFLIPSISLSRSTDLGKIISAISFPKDGDPHLPLKTYRLSYQLLVFNRFI